MFYLTPYVLFNPICLTPYMVCFNPLIPYIMVYVLTPLFPYVFTHMSIVCMCKYIYIVSRAYKERGHATPISDSIAGEIQSVTKIVTLDF